MCSNNNIMFFYSLEPMLTKKFPTFVAPFRSVTWITYRYIHVDFSMMLYNIFKNF